nr:RTX iron-regulated FrpC family protein [Neisseria subflava]
MDNQIPITGFERNIKIDLNGTLMSVPYGYLAGSSRDSATRWMSDEEKSIRAVGLIFTSMPNAKEILGF